MMHDNQIDPPRRPDVRAPRFQLRYAPVFWWVALAGFVAIEVIFWLTHVRPKIPFRPRIRRILIMAAFSPRFLLYAVLIASIVTVVADLVFRLLARPLMRRWYHPRCLDPTAAHPLPFRLGIGEEIQEERPARRLIGRTKQPGTAVLTNRRIYFFPFAWDAESWSLPREHVARARLRTPRRRVLGWVTGYPDHLVITEDSGEETTLILADPTSALAWFVEPEAVADDESEASSLEPAGARS